MGNLTDDFIECERCAEWIRNNTRAKLKHLNTVHRTTSDTEKAIGKFMCIYCQKPYAAPNTLKRHQIQAHGLFSPTPSPVLCIKKISKQPDRYYNCDNLKPSDFKFNLKYAPQPYYSRKATTNGYKYVKYSDWNNKTKHQ